MTAVDLFLAVAVCAAFWATGFAMGHSRGARDLGRDLLAAATDVERRAIADAGERAARLLRARWGARP